MDIHDFFYFLSTTYFTPLPLIDLRRIFNPLQIPNPLLVTSWAHFQPANIVYKLLVLAHPNSDYFWLIAKISSKESTHPESDDLRIILVLEWREVFDCEVDGLVLKQTKKAKSVLSKDCKNYSSLADPSYCGSVQYHADQSYNKHPLRNNWLQEIT